jgi:hypothetical protein
MARAILLLSLIAPLIAMQPAAAAPPPGGDASAAVRFVRSMLDGMVEVSHHPTHDRRAFYESLIRNDIDWNGPAMRALGPRWSTLGPDDRRKLADWSRDSLLDAGSVMEFIQNLMFGRCDITGRDAESDGAMVRFSCSRFGNEPSFSLRMQVLRRGDRFQITDVSYVGISLIEAMGEALRKPEAVAQHGVNIGAQ